MDTHRRRQHAFTIVELLVVISIIGLLLGLLLPAISKARQQAKLTQSQSNLRMLGTAHATYASEWNDRQFTLTKDDLSRYGNQSPTAVQAYFLEHEQYPPPVILGWGAVPGGSSDEPPLHQLRVLPDGEFRKNYVLLEPIAFRPPWGGKGIDIERFGYFRMPNARQFSQYLSGRFFDPVFYAPQDAIVMSMFDPISGLPGEYTSKGILIDSYGWGAEDFCYSSYSLSPAGLFSPDVLRNAGEGGFQDPWLLPAGFRAPAMSQATYSSLKTHMLEHHWLQNTKPRCNEDLPVDAGRPYFGCQPYFFNHSWESAPATLFYDGHVALIGVRDAQRDDGQVQVQTGTAESGLWSRDTPFGDDGYFISSSFDDAASSLHILTTDGIRGRDVLSQ